MAELTSDGLDSANDFGWRHWKISNRIR